MSTTKKDSLIEALTLQLRFVSANSVLFSQAVADRVGIHSTDNECLDLLLLNGAMTAGQIADRTGLTTGSVTAMLDRLEKAGFARRQRDPLDRRKVIVTPVMEKIGTAIAPHAALMGDAVAGVCAGFSEAELATVLRFVIEANAAAEEVIVKVRA